MVMSPAVAIDVAKRLISDAESDRVNISNVDSWLSGRNPLEQYRKAHQPTDSEKVKLGRLAATPLLDLIVSEVAQQMRLDGVSMGDPVDADRLFEPFERSGMVSRQYALWKSTLSYGKAYVIALPGQDERAWMSGYSPRDLFVEWNDPIEDTHPAFALRTIGKPGSEIYRVYDNEAVYFLGKEANGLAFIEARPHGLGVTPVVEFANDLDLEGNSTGDVEKYQVVASRYEKTVFDRLLAQHNNSWKVRWATGLDMEGMSDAERAETKMKLGHDDILTGGEGVSFGTLPETTLDSLIRAAESDRDMLAAVSQTPVWALNGGQLVNLSADALVEARSMQRLKVGQKKLANGVGIAKLLRLAARVEGRSEDAERYDITANWADVEARSLSQSADALGKIVQMLNVPPELVLDMIPGISSKKAGEWRAYMAEHPSGEVRVAEAINRQLGI